ncbi:hypothetical protein [uncultured Winogradskyella sp.]|uniref:hypothetical protein n=1 Tax=uncultured Winogradskyella sp. TaxID=395353 RepID=UPI002603EA51|nr:hypothetical protein [uncultured Winogradskyella sp.]
MKIFNEEQRFNQNWLIILILIGTLIPLGIMAKEYTTNQSSFSTSDIIMFTSVILVSASIIFIFKLDTRIDDNGIHYKFFPSHWSFKVIRWNEIEKVYVRTYSAISEYGDWGLRGSSLLKSSKGKAINVSGDIGIQLELINGKKLLIGTQKRTEAISVLETYKEKLK